LTGGTNSEDFKRQFINLLQKEYKLEVAEKLHWLLQMEILETDDSISINQAKYTKDILSEFGLNDCKTAKTPLPSDFVISDYDSPNPENALDQQKYPYSKLLGKLLWLSRCTRPDLAFPISVMGRFASNPSLRHYKALMHMVKYLKGTQNYCIKYQKAGNDDNIMYAYSDADWAGCVDTRKSTSGFLAMLNGGPIDWLSQKQSIVTLSSTESEYCALSTAAKTTKYLRNLLESIGLTQTNATDLENIKEYPKGLFNDATILLGDNQGSLFLGNNPKTNSRTKHIDTRHHFIRECTLSNIIKLAYTSTQTMLADMFTKPLGSTKLAENRSAIMSLL